LGRVDYREEGERGMILRVLLVGIILSIFLMTIVDLVR
jgi:hypothetical protein